MSGNITKETQILNALRSVGSNGITNVELSDIALRYGGYLGKLYEKGYKIEKERLGNGVFKYTLISEPEVEFKSKMSALDKLLKAVENVGSVDSNQLKNLMESLRVSVRNNAGTHNS